MSQKKKAYARIESGEAAIIIGTHALIQEKVLYRNLALVVTDEQHRFGVRQRETLAQKGKTPHILVMSATPIPRTLAIILYGDLDISIINEMPKNRLPIKNCVVNTEYREKAYRFMRKQVLEGRQCYVICPMVEESESLDAENVIDYSQMLAEELGDGIHVGCLHGKMKQKEKDEIMSAFGKMKFRYLYLQLLLKLGSMCQMQQLCLLKMRSVSDLPNFISFAGVSEEADINLIVFLCLRLNRTRQKKDLKS